MERRKWLLTISVLALIAVTFVYVKAQLIPDRTSLDALRKNTKNVAFMGNLPSFSELVNQVKPTIVNISTTTVVKGPDMQDRFMGPANPFKDFFGDDFMNRFFGNAPRKEYKQNSLGSGFLIDRDGFILTNNHVVEKATSIRVKLADGKEYDAKVIGKDPKTDIALIKIDANHTLPSATFGDSDKLFVGDWVVAIGNPFGLEHTVTAGIVSAKGRVIGAGPYDDFIQTDASINPGNSGGPLLNLKGEVIGINTAIVSGGQGIGFAIPINVVQDLMSQLKNKGKVSRGWLGVVIQKITPEIAKNFRLNDIEGALVADVSENGPAEKAGIKRGDVVTTFDGKKVKDSEMLPKLVAVTEIGKKVRVGLIRDGKPMELDVIIGELPEETPKPSKKPDIEMDFGLVVQEITPEIARHFDLKDRKGVIVTDVTPGSPSAEADIRSGDIIREVARKPVRSISEFKDAMKSANIKEGIVILITREGTTFYSVLRE